jgi:hypothetical protein
MEVANSEGRRVRSRRIAPLASLAFVEAGAGSFVRDQEPP